MKKARNPKSPLPRRSGHRPGRARADGNEEEFDEIESLPRDAEHIEDDQDPDPERYPALSEHAQERRAS